MASPKAIGCARLVSPAVTVRQQQHSTAAVNRKVLNALLVDKQLHTVVQLFRILLKAALKAIQPRLLKRGANSM
jgi:hypothetical protein